MRFFIFVSVLILAACATETPSTTSGFPVGALSNGYIPPEQSSTPPPQSPDYGNSYIQTPNAYGPGIHMDQYGRAVTITPR